MVVVLQVIEGALKEFFGEILIGIALTAVYFLKENYRMKKDLTTVQRELEMSKEKTRLDKHEERLDDFSDMMSEIQTSIDEIERHFTGDDEDPTRRGLLVETHQLKQDVRDIRNALIRLDSDNDDIKFDFEESED